MAAKTFALEVKWDVPNMPELTGPFDSEQDAVSFARLNVPNGSWTVREMTYPYSSYTEEVRVHLTRPEPSASIR